METVELYLQNSRGAGTRLRIPAAYMQWRDDRKGGVSDSIIALVAVYPEMIPYASLSRDERRKFQNWEIDAQPLRFDPLIHLRDAIPGTLDRLHFSDRLVLANRVVSDERSFITYRANFAGTVKGYFVPSQQIEAGPVLECLPLPPGTTADTCRTNCLAYAQYSDRMLLVYSVPRRSIDQWREIDGKVRALIKSFVVDCFEGPPLSDGDAPENFHICPD
jgi:hypothetical protein